MVLVHILELLAVVNLLELLVTASSASEPLGSTLLVFLEVALVE